MAIIHVRNLTGKIIHSVVVDQPQQLFPADLRNLDLSNADLTGADLPDADFTGGTLIGASLKEANLARARGLSDLRYCDLAGCDLTGCDLRGVQIYPANYTKKTKLLDAKIDEGSELQTIQREIAAIKRWKDFRRVNP
jgi:uncharacterized protein YjbI with pentapeptide repeats